MGKRWRSVVAALVVSALVVAGCGGDGVAEPLLSAPKTPEDAQKLRELSPGEYREYMEGDDQ